MDLLLHHTSAFIFQSPPSGGGNKIYSTPFKKEQGGRGGFQTMNIRVRTVLKNRRDRIVRKGNVMWIWIQWQLPFTKMAWKFWLRTNFGFTMKLPEIIQTSIFIIRKLKASPHLNPKSFREFSNLETEVSNIVETNITDNLKELPASVDDFNYHFFLVRQS